jgi:hypothetical protein
VTAELTAFIAERHRVPGDVSASRAPYIQHRGGPKGFIKVVDGGTSALPTTRETGSTSRSATSRATTAPISFCSISPSAGGSRSGDAREW